MPIPFPAIRCSTGRILQPGVFPVRRFQGPAGSTTTTIRGDRPYELRLVLEFNMITDLDAADIWATWHASHGGFREVTLPANALDGIDPALVAQIPANISWYMDGAPEVTSVQPGWSRMQVAFIGRLAMYIVGTAGGGGGAEPVADFWTLQYVGEGITQREAISYVAPDGNIFWAIHFTFNATPTVARMAIVSVRPSGAFRWARIITMAGTGGAVVCRRMSFAYNPSDQTFYCSLNEPLGSFSTLAPFIYSFSATGSLNWDLRLSFTDYYPSNGGRAIIKGMVFDAATSTLLIAGSGGWTYPVGDAQNMFYGRVSVSGALVSLRYANGVRLDAVSSGLPDSNYSPLVHSGSSSEYNFILSAGGTLYSADPAAADSGTHVVTIDAATGLQTAIRKYQTARFVAALRRSSNGRYVCIGSGRLFELSADLTAVTESRTFSPGGISNHINELGDGSLLLSESAAAGLSLASSTPTSGSAFTGSSFADYRFQIIASDLASRLSSGVGKVTPASASSAWAQGQSKNTDRVVMANSTASFPSLVSHSSSLPYPGLHRFSLSISSSSTQIGFTSAVEAIASGSDPVTSIITPTSTSGAASDCTPAIIGQVLGTEADLPGTFIVFTDDELLNA